MRKNRNLVLIIQSQNEIEGSIAGILRANNYDVILSDHFEILQKRIDDRNIDLIICPHKIQSETAFLIFKRLKPFLVKSGIPFFVWFDHYEKEEIEIGLELGIDNFLFKPFVPESVLSKVSEALQKRRELNVFDLASFESYFKKSSVAMLFLERDIISSVNEAFLSFTKASEPDIINLPFETVFDLCDIKQNQFNFKRFCCGVINSCKLLNVVCCNNPNLYFDVSLFRGNQFDVSSAFAELQLSSTVFNSTQAIDSSVLRHEVKVKEIPQKITLTEREKEVFHLSAKGWGLKQIAAELKLSQRTVEKHRANIMRKTDTHSMYEAILTIGRAVLK